MENKFLNLDGLSTFLTKIKEIFATKEQGSKADSALQKSDITSGSSNGTISVKGSNVSVKGLGTAAYTQSSTYAAANHTHNNYNRVVVSATQPEDLLPGDIWVIVEE